MMACGRGNYVFFISILIAGTAVSKEYNYEFGEDSGDKLYLKSDTLQNNETELVIPAPSGVGEHLINIIVSSEDAPEINTVLGDPLIRVAIKFDREQPAGSYYNITVKGTKNGAKDSIAKSGRRSAAVAIDLDTSTPLETTEIVDEHPPVAVNETQLVIDSETQSAAANESQIVVIDERKSVNPDDMQLMTGAINDSTLPADATIVEISDNSTLPAKTETVNETQLAINETELVNANNTQSANANETQLTATNEIQQNTQEAVDTQPGTETAENGTVPVEIIEVSDNSTQPVTIEMANETKSVPADDSQSGAVNETQSLATNETDSAIVSGLVPVNETQLAAEEAENSTMSAVDKEATTQSTAEVQNNSSEPVAVDTNTLSQETQNGNDTGSVTPEANLALDSNTSTINAVHNETSAAEDIDAQSTTSEIHITISNEGAVQNDTQASVESNPNIAVTVAANSDNNATSATADAGGSV